MYDNERDAGSYLNNTVCWWDGKPIWVERVGGGFITQVYMLPIGRADPVQIDIRDKRFECMKYNLGYVNWSDGHTVYAQRRPARGVQQGLSDNNTVLTGGNVDRPYMISNAIREQGFVDMLMGKYPSIKEAHELMGKKGTRGVAFDRKLALARHDHFNNLFYLRYRGRDVSWSDCVEFNLPEEYRYLQETCEPTGVMKKKVA